MVSAIIREAVQKNGRIAETVHTVYFGGGTPSLLDPDELQRIIEALKDNYAIAANAEITLEANPDDLRPDVPARWREAGINRISLGIQSFDDRELAWMSRNHDAMSALSSLQEIKKAGFDNYSADLIFGSQASGPEILDRNLSILLNEKVPHISCYALTVEEGTLLKKRITEKKEIQPDEDMQASQFMEIMDRLSDAGYEHYEISNFALTGYRSRHNSSYWKNIKYLGLGPSAHSFDGDRTRSANVADNRKYIELITAGEDPGMAETLSDNDLLNEHVMIRIRMAEGLDLNYIRNRFGAGEADRIESCSAPIIGKGWMEKNDEKLVLTRTGKLMADGIAVGFFTGKN